MGDRSKTSSCCRRQRRKQLLSSLSQMYGFGDRRDRGGRSPTFLGDRGHKAPWVGIPKENARTRVQTHTRDDESP